MKYYRFWVLAIFACSMSTGLAQSELERFRKGQNAKFENFRKRTEKEKTMMFETGAKSVIEKILPVIDNFERGFAAVAADAKTPFEEGMEMVYKQLMAELEKMDTANAKRREKEDPRKTENAKLMEKIVAILSEATEPMQIDPIVESLAIDGLTRQRVSSLCTLLVKDERIVAEDVKVKGKGKRKAYSIA